jgi:starch synthase
LPGYPAALARAHGQGCDTLCQLEIHGRQADIIETVTEAGRVTTWLVDCPELYQRPGTPYQDGAGLPWPDNHLRYGFFCRVAVELALGRAGLNWTPDVVHCNDWQTGLVPALLKLEHSAPPTLFTLHNLAYQGVFSREQFIQLQLPDVLWSPDSLEYHGQFSFLKGGLVHADRINTVSPGYAGEIQTPTFGCGLDGVLRQRSSVLSGVLNGIDTELWNPATDDALVQNYTLDTLAQKQANKADLLRQFDLNIGIEAPLLGFIGRLVEQKGIDLLVEALPELLDAGAGIVMLGSGEPHFEQMLRTMEGQYPNRVALVVGYDEALSHRIEAGVDIFLMPSRFEPCGLNQLYSLRYGTIPVVHKCGGLADTVVDCTEETLADGTGNGFVFEHADAAGLLYAARRAMAAYHDKTLWHSLQRNGMSLDLSWRQSALAYEQLYRQAAGRAQ